MGHVVPLSLADALSALSAPGGARILAGGTDLFPSLGEELPPAVLVDVTRLADLHGITPDPSGGWRIGAATTWSQLIAADLPPCFDALKAAAREIGSVQIQNAGTLAGNLCNASPAADGVPPLLALDAGLELAGPQGIRRLSLGEFLLGPRKTALAPGELMVALHVPDQPRGAVSAFRKLGSRRYLVISIVMVAANLWLDGGRIAGARVAVGAAGPVARRLPALEAALLGRAVERLGAVTTPDHLAPLAPIDDVRGSAAYRLSAVAELCDRAIAGALGQPHG